MTWAAEAKGATMHLVGRSLTSSLVARGDR